MLCLCFTWLYVSCTSAYFKCLTAHWNSSKVIIPCVTRLSLARLFIYIELLLTTFFPRFALLSLHTELSFPVIFSIARTHNVCPCKSRFDHWLQVVSQLCLPNVVTWPVAFTPGPCVCPAVAFTWQNWKSECVALVVNIRNLTLSTFPFSPFHLPLQLFNCSTAIFSPSLTHSLSLPLSTRLTRRQRKRQQLSIKL